MTTYRIYFLSHGAQIEKGRNVECRNDQLAIEHASSLARTFGQVQVWCSSRCLGLFPGRILEPFQELSGFTAGA